VCHNSMIEADAENQPQRDYERQHLDDWLTNRVRRSTSDD
jgi:hypothetical protein